MPELSKPLIAVIGVLVSIAILFIAVLGILPFLQGTISSTGQSAQFSAVASAATTKSGGTITNIIFTVTVQKLAGVGGYTVSAIDVYNPSGTQVTGPTITPTLPRSFNQSVTFTVNLGTGTYSPGDWAIVITIEDAHGNPIQSLSVSVPVS